jgi:hypothetical protein
MTCKRCGGTGWEHILDTESVMDTSSYYTLPCRDCLAKHLCPRCGADLMECICGWREERERGESDNE